MLDSLLLKLVQQHSDNDNLDPMRADAFERPIFYVQWIAPVRYLLAMRYLKHKKAILNAFTEQGIYPVYRRDYLAALEARLQQKSWFGRLKHPELWFTPVTVIVFYPLLVAGLIFGCFYMHNWYMDKKISLALADRMPYYSELLHRAQVARQYANDEYLDKYLKQAEAEKHNILSLVPDKGAVHVMLDRALSSMQNDSLSNAEIMIQFKNLNRTLDAEGIPYYLSPKLFFSECSSFAPEMDKQKNAIINLLDRLMRGQEDVQEQPLCRTGIITTYHVDSRRALNYADAAHKELPLYHVTRADRIPAADSALGLTFKSQGIGSLILLDQIQRFAEQSILPALTFQGRNYIIPYWLQGYYDIEESITKNYQTDIAALFPTKESQTLLRAAAKEMLHDQQHLSSSRMQQTLQRSTPPTLDNGGIMGGLDAISGMIDSIQKPEQQPAQQAARQELDEMMMSLLPSIEYHEAYHQIVKDNWPVPDWVGKNFAQLSENGIESSLEELGAYLTQLVYTDVGQKVWLTKLLLFSLNSMTQDQPEYYASSMIFSALRDSYLLRDITPNHTLSVDEKVEIYKALSSMSTSELQQHARKVFEFLFERPVVILQ
ncbi:MAG: hypothetical protein CSB47_08945 [Proteobacteria bacterium]|nr:MAG: hypothetical protein CSB47_08945 [Pseudomonadota bacterium]